MTYFLKDPAAEATFGLDWADWLGGAAITGSAWSVAPAETGGLGVRRTSAGPAVTTVTLVGGVAGRIYRASNRVTLNDGRVDERAVVVRVEER